jgi:DNA-directed RNA polymerase specialized sigma24 family protein
VSETPRSDLARALARLEPYERVLLCLTRLEGMKIPQIAATLDRPESRVASDLLRAERKLLRLTSRLPVVRRA